VTDVATLTVYLHPRCSKSRAAVDLLEARDVPFERVDYLETPPDAATLGRLVDMLGGDPADLVRVDDDRFGQLGLQPTDVADRAGVVTVLVAHPELMQRPIVVRGDVAVVARPAQRLQDLLDHP
jgi:arsenate reductase